MRLDLRKLRFRQRKLVATHLCLLFGSRESRHYARANIFMSPDPKVRGFVALVKKNPAGVTGGVVMEGTVSVKKSPPSVMILTASLGIASGVPGLAGDDAVAVPL